MPDNRTRSVYSDSDEGHYSSDFVLDNNPDASESSGGARYMVVDCGGGTVDITVHEITCGDGDRDGEGQLGEVFKATGGPYGSVSKFSGSF